MAKARGALDEARDRVPPDSAASAVRRGRELPESEAAARAVEFEGVVKVLFAEQGTKDQLLATLRSIRDQAERTRGEHVTLAADLAESGGPFPDRLHVNELVFKFMWEQTETVIGWATWAEDHVARWPDDIASPTAPETGDVLRRVTTSG